MNPLINEMSDKDYHQFLQEHIVKLVYLRLEQSFHQWKKSIFQYSFNELRKIGIVELIFILNEDENEETKFVKINDDINQETLIAYKKVW